MPSHPSYLDLSLHELEERARRAVASLADCRACPRDCRVNRLDNQWSACKTGRYAIVASHFPHFGEEDCLRGWNGSGTIFFGHCNLRCVFCQNFDISQGIPPPRLSRRTDGPDGPGDPTAAQRPGARPEQIAAMMLQLQARGCHNINFVTPEHVVPQVLEALVPAIRAGLQLPIVYNTSAYDSPESLESMNGIVDIYMPDFKYWSAAGSKRYLMAGDYPDVARAAIAEMHEQVGPLTVDDRGIARRGLLIRHLVMPGCLEETRAILSWIAEELGPGTYVNVMGQYRPEGKVSTERYSEIDRGVSVKELGAAIEMARDLGLRLDEREPHPRRLAGMTMEVDPRRNPSR